VDLRLFELEREELVAPDQRHGQYLRGSLLRLLQPIQRWQGEAAEVGEVRGELFELQETQLHEVGAQAAAVDGLGTFCLQQLRRGEDLVREEVLPELTHGLLDSVHVENR